MVSGIELLALTVTAFIELLELTVTGGVDERLGVEVTEWTAVCDELESMTTGSVMTRAFTADNLWSLRGRNAPSEGVEVLQPVSAQKNFLKLRMPGWAYTGVHWACTLGS